MNVPHSISCLNVATQQLPMRAFKRLQFTRLHHQITTNQQYRYLLGDTATTTPINTQTDFHKNNLSTKINKLKAEITNKQWFNSDNVKTQLLSWLDSILTTTSNTYNVIFELQQTFGVDVLRDITPNAATAHQMDHKFKLHGIISTPNGHNITIKTNTISPTTNQSLSDPILELPFSLIWNTVKTTNFIDIIRQSDNVHSLASIHHVNNNDFTSWFNHNKPIFNHHPMNHLKGFKFTTNTNDLQLQFNQFINCSNYHNQHINLLWMSFILNEIKPM